MNDTSEVNPEIKVAKAPKSSPATPAVSKETPKEKEPVAETKSAPKASATEEWAGDDKTPSLWYIEARGDKIHCKNTSTGRTFEGTREEFSANIRG